MSQNEQTYLDVLQHVMDNGIDRPDRTGVGVRSVFGMQTRFDLRNTFPLLTTKKVNFAAIASELLWFIEGSGDERRLAEIRFGKDRSELSDKKTIWTGNAQAPYWKDKAAFDGDLGTVYGVQWRKWRTPVVKDDGTVEVRETDQLATLIEGIKRDPFGRRHILSAWNPGELDQMALPPCHVMAQFYVSGDELSCMLYQRSNDLFLGSPFNIASYAMLTRMIAQVCDLKVGDFVYTQGDTHIYHNHLDQVAEQLTRKPKRPPHLYIDPTVSNIDDFRMEHFEVVNYEHHGVLKAPMAV